MGRRHDVSSPIGGVENHTFAMTKVGAVVAVFVYVWFGLKFISKSWFNLDLIWAISLIFVGAFSIYSATTGHH